MIRDGAIREAVEQGLKSKDRSICIHAVDRVSNALIKHFNGHPEMVMSSLMMALGGQKGELKSMMDSVVGKEADITCEDVLCLPCRKLRLIDRVNATEHDLPEDLIAAKDFLGMEIMLSVKWIVEILQGTIASKRSSNQHREKAEFALHKTMSMVMVSAAVVADLQSDLAQAIEDRDKYHRLADMLMDQEVD